VPSLVVIVGSEQQSLSAGPAEALREEEAKRAGAELGLKPEDILFLRLSDHFVSCGGEEAERAIGAIVDCVREMSAGSLFVSWRHDPHCDYEASYRIVREAPRRVGELKLFEYVVWGHTLPPSTEVNPIRSGFRIRIDQEGLEKKCRAIAAHRSQTSDLIDDDPDGFLFSQIDLAHFVRMSSFLKATHERTGPKVLARCGAAIAKCQRLRDC
jgi:LmbE family N-acetylglucosaminyl deacetylase